MLQLLLNKIFEIGTEHAKDQFEEKKIKLINQIALFSLFNHIIIISLLFYSNYTFGGQLVCINMLFHSSVIVLNKYGMMKTARFLGLLSGSITTFLLGYLGGEELSIQLFYYLLLVGSFVIHDSKESRHLIINLVTTTGFYILSEYFFKQNHALITIKPEYIFIISTTIKIIVFLCSSIFLFILLKANEKSEKKLVSQNKKLITTTKSLEEKKDLVIKQQEVLQKALTVRSEFLSNISHEIRTPLNAIVGFSELMQSKENSVDIQPLIYIEKASKSLLAIVNDILDLSKMENNKFILENESFYIKEKITDVKEFVKDSLEKKNLEFSINISPSVPKVFIGDGRRLFQVILNLVSNATKFTKKGSITINVSSQKKSNDFHLVRIDIVDTGIGIKEKRLNQIFESFTQEQEYISKEFGGTGLGLTISKQIVQLMNGKISVVSSKGIGSTFTIEIPFKTMIETPFQPQPLSVDHNKNSCIEHLKILLIEDNEMNRLLTRQMIKGTFSHIDEAVDGAEALDLLKANSYDLVLLDLQMPQISGFDVYMQYQDFNKENNTQFIVITADVFPEAKEKAERLGIKHFITKPINRLQLLEKINAIFEE